MVSIRQSDSFKIKIDDVGDIELSVPDYKYLENISNIDDIFKLLIYNDYLFNTYNLSDEYLNKIYLYVTNKITFDDLDIMNDGIVLFNCINSYFRKYNKIPSSDTVNIVVRCNKSNILKALQFNFKNIYSDGIGFEDLYQLLKGLDLKKYDDAGTTIKIEGCSRRITLSSLFSIASIIRSDADKIKGMNLSPLEKVIYVYDVVKARSYKENKEEPEKARDLDYILYGTDIVCPGYSKYYNTLLSFFNIPSIKIVSRQKNHSVSLTYIKDDKYNIDGFLAFDITKDSNKTGDYNYINKYDGFAISLSYLHLYEKYTIEKFKKLGISFEELIKEVLFSEDHYYDSLEILEFLFKMCGRNNNIIENIHDYNLLGSRAREKIKKEYESFMRAFLNTTLDLETFFKALYNARRIEYYIGLIPEMNMSDIRNSSINWSFRRYREMCELDEGNAKFLSFLCINEFLKQNEENFISSSVKNSPSIERDSYNIRLLRVLNNEIKRKS